MEKKKGLLIVIVVVIVLAVFVIGSYNGLVTGREAVSTAQANIDTTLQRRADLIPNLVASVKSFAAHETEVFDKVLAARERLMSAGGIGEKAEADAELTRALGGLNLVVENYPELKSDATYISLMDELAGSENRIAVARKDYNDAAQRYNNRIISFPSNLFASAFGFEKADYFKASEGADAAPDLEGQLP